MPTHVPNPTDRAASPSAETPRIHATATVRPVGRHGSEPPPPLTLCWHCGAATKARVPEGWATAWLGTGAPANEPHGFGVCPPCLDVWPTFTNTDPAAGRAADHQGSLGGGRG